MDVHEPTPASLRVTAMNLLAMREHSAKELWVKLAKRCEQTDLLFATVAKLQRDGLQSDVRFAQAFINMRLRQGKGAQLIRLELREKGISDELIHEYLINSLQEADWNLLALKAYRKKFGDTPLADLKEKSKRIRFLTARGFSTANILYALQQSLLQID